MARGPLQADSLDRVRAGEVIYKPAGGPGGRRLPSDDYQSSRWINADLDPLSIEPIPVDHDLHRLGGPSSLRIGCNVDVAGLFDRARETVADLVDIKPETSRQVRKRDHGLGARRLRSLIDEPSGDPVLRVLDESPLIYGPVSYQKVAVVELCDTFWDMAQSFTETDTAVIQRARRKRREVIVLREDRGWLEEFSSTPNQMLRRMARRGALIPLGAGRYAIPIIGSDSVAYKAWQPMLDARLAPLGAYYLGGFSALAEHHLTDLSEPSAFVVVGFANRLLLQGHMAVAERPLRAALSRRPVFTQELGVEKVRLSRTETYMRSNPTRALVDCLWHPEICGATETWVTAWGRGALRLDAETAIKYGAALGPSVLRRLGLILDMLGHGETARRLIPSRVRRADRVTPLVDDGPDPDPSAEIDEVWKVALNVPRDRIYGWLSYGK